VTGRLSKSTYIKWGGDNSSEARETQTVTTYTYAATLETITSLQTVTDMRNGEVRARKYEYALQQWEDSSRQKIILASNVFDMKFFSPDGDTRIKMEYGYGLFLEDGREIETHTFTSTRSGAPTEVTVVKIGPNRGLIEITRAGGAVCNSDSTREEWTQCVDGIWDYIHDRFTKFSLQGSLYNSSPPPN